MTAKPSIRKHHMNDDMFVLVPCGLKQSDQKEKEDTNKGVSHFLFGDDDCPHGFSCVVETSLWATASCKQVSMTRGQANTIRISV